MIAQSLKIDGVVIKIENNTRFEESKQNKLYI